MNCAKLVGSADLFCVPCSEKGKCIRCFNLNLRCESVRENYESFFREVQQYFQFYDLQTAFEARKAWFNRMDGTYGLLSIALFDNALGMLNRNLEQLINLQREKVSGFVFKRSLKHLETPLLTIIEGCKPPVDADREADEEPKQRLEIQAHREHITELEGLVAQETARYGMQTNKKLKIKSGRRVERLKLDLAQAKASLAELEADEVA